MSDLKEILLDYLADKKLSKNKEPAYERIGKSVVEIALKLPYQQLVDKPDKVNFTIHKTYALDYTFTSFPFPLHYYHPNYRKN